MGQKDLHGTLTGVLVLLSNRSEHCPMVVEKCRVLVEAAAMHQGIALAQSILHCRTELDQQVIARRHQDCMMKREVGRNIVGGSASTSS